MTPRYARWIVIAAAAVAVLVAAAGRGDPEARAEEPELVLRYLFSPTPRTLLVPLIDRFNGESHRSGDREVRIDGVALNSGEAEAALAAGREQRRALDTCVVALGQAPQPRRLGGLGARREPLDSSSRPR